MGTLTMAERAGRTINKLMSECVSAWSTTIEFHSIVSVILYATTTCARVMKVFMIV